ncbi:FAD-dependent oxidoreductase [Pseudogracilibacillus auburnensis]|uniref:Ferredoxin--NADP+ reductase n=1 Tax=Pseudogracilibacillus auburnensis TaxID=1494959 RepID=A0A2V3VPU3_9BACI|nr:FAD-dependent oxidoreductase [Pseudogracilibacillus auburnensis]PXW83826.1 ferredoxin--NADP+ reductase [Pseudogracilibacillus auburnensis]
MQIYWTKINKIIEETPEVKTYMIDCPEGFTWEEGAHTHLALKGFNAGDKPNRGLVRHMSIMTLPHENLIGITTRIREQCSAYKMILRNLEVGDKVALFKTHSNVPLKREGKNVYLLSSGVGLATFRPLVLDYFGHPENVTKIHSLNIDSSREFLFTDIFETSREKKFTSQFVDNRQDYYEEVKNLASDKGGLFYVVGSDEFLRQNIDVLRDQGIKPEQIMLDKREQQRPTFLSIELPM